MSSASFRRRRFSSNEDLEGNIENRKNLPDGKNGLIFKILPTLSGNKNVMPGEGIEARVDVGGAGSRTSFLPAILHNPRVGFIIRTFLNEEFSEENF